MVIQKRGCQSCRFTRGGKRFAIAYTDGLQARTAKVKGKVLVCRVAGGSCTKARKKVRLSFVQVRIS